VSTDFGHVFGHPIVGEEGKLSAHGQRRHATDDRERLYKHGFQSSHYLYSRRNNGDKAMSWTDPIVEEVRQAREEYAARFGYDLRKIFRDLKEKEKLSGRNVVPASQTIQASSLCEEMQPTNTATSQSH
jgi:hypothetical protein